jgi:4-hydroxybenzoate polyprenyltransferase
LAAYAPLAATFAASAVCFSSLVRGVVAWPSITALLVAFFTCLLFFLQLRIADEFKDYEDDARYRSYRPVQRGLVSLRELAVVGIAAAVIQLVLAIALDATIVWVLGIAWIYLVLMMREFFAPHWLKRHPIVYMTSHMMILPLIGLYATACDWWVAGIRLPPAGLYWFFAVNYLSGLVIEIGRKTRVPANEETGVETYSALWGSRNAVCVWVIAILLTAVATWRASARIGVDMPMLILVAVLAIACGLVAVRFLRQQTTSSGKLIDVTSGVCTLLMYIALGTAPLVYRLW